ncbi:MAG TPA: hypothetical protein VKZ73_03325 [Microbacterium sp.]|nr:hypothetical protein [Microbacterium sp.]
MTEPQVWTLIGVFAAIMLGAMSLMTTLIMRSTTVAIGGLRNEMVARFMGVDAQFAAMDAKFEALEATVDARLETINVKLEHLDRDVTVLMRRAWGEPTTD